MTVGHVAADIWAVVITVCLLSVVVFFFLWAGASILTLAQARRSAKHRPALLTGLARGCTVSDLEEIDRELQQVLAQEHWPQPARAHRRS